MCIELNILCICTLITERRKMTTPIKIVITGGPCAGKTSIIERLKVDFDGIASFVPESATILLEGGYPAPPEDSAKRETWLSELQAVVGTLQLQLEAMVLRNAVSADHSLIILDRSLGDLPAYHPRGYEAVMYQLKAHDTTTLRDRYHHILHLHPLANMRAELYGKVGNASRYETREQAVKIDRRIRGSNEWLAMNGFYDVLPRANFEQKYLEVKNIIVQSLATVS